MQTNAGWDASLPFCWTRVGLFHFVRCSRFLRLPLSRTSCFFGWWDVCCCFSACVIMFSCAGFSECVAFPFALLLCSKESFIHHHRISPLTNTTNQGLCYYKGGQVNRGERIFSLTMIQGRRIYLRSGILRLGILHISPWVLNFLAGSFFESWLEMGCGWFGNLGFLNLVGFPGDFWVWIQKWELVPLENGKIHTPVSLWPRPNEYMYVTNAFITSHRRHHWKGWKLLVRLVA